MEIRLKRRKLFSILIQSFTIIILAACKPAAAPNNETVASNDPVPVATAVTEPALQPEKGIIQSMRSASGDATVTYALYIPQSCGDHAKCPLLLLFDPQGKGTTPINKYKDLAEKHQMILMCSNTSKNGNSPEVSNHIIKILIAEALQQLPADSNRIYACGFSGGGRVATMVLPHFKKLKGIISIGAGSTPNPPVKTCRYIGVAGLQDFNYKEVKEAAEKLQGPMPVTAVYHNGIHEWCPADLMDRIFLLLDADAMRNKTLAVNNKPLQKEATEARQESGALERSGNFSAAVDRIAFAMECLKDLLEDKELSSSYARLTKSPAYEKNKKENEQLDKDQELLTGKYLQMVGQPMNQWEDALKLLRGEMNKMKGSPRYFMYKRVLASLSIQCYMLCKQNIYNVNMKNATYLSELYLLIDPENKDAHYYAAILAARNNKPDKVYSELNQSITYGFSDREMAMGESAFRSISNTTQFNAVLQRIEK